MTELNAILQALPRRIDGIVTRWARQSPAAPALLEDGRVWSYAELEAAVATAAGRLQILGVRPGDRLMLVGENCAALAVLIFAASRLDAWAVIVNARLSPREIDTLRAHCRPRRLVFTVAVSPDAAAHARRLEAGAVDFPGLEGLAVGPLDETGSPEPVSPEPREQVAALIYTSGTTGAPKGVMLSHHNLLFIAAVSSGLRRLSPADRAYGVLPVSHVYGLASVFLGTLYAGAALHMAPRFSPEATTRALAQDGITAFQGVPAMYAKLLELAMVSGRRPEAPKLRFIYAGGSPLDPTLKARVEQVFGLPLHNGYGMTESSPTISQTRIEAPRADTSVGQPIPGVAVRLVDFEGRDVAPGKTGELWVQGPNVMKGYYRNPELTAQMIRPGGWLNTGDLARQDPDGALFIVGRTKELIIRSGFNVYPVEVETVLNSHPDVIHSAVVGRAVEGNEEVVAFVELAPGSPTRVADLHAYLKDWLSPYKRPEEIVVLPALPAAANGKILKNQLKELAQSKSPRLFDRND